MKMDIHAIFNFSSVAYVSFRHGCFTFIFFDEVCNRHVFPSIYMLNDPRYTVADPRYTSSVLHILPSHTLEYRAREHWKNKNAGNVANKRMRVRIWNIANVGGVLLTTSILHLVGMSCI